MILQNGNEPNSLYRMDLEYGKVVDEWKVHDDISVTTFAPEKVRIPFCKFVIMMDLADMYSEILPNDWGTNVLGDF